MPGRVFVPRPGVIVGPWDPTARFTSWIHRVAQGGEVLAPGRPEQRVQFIDVRDLAEWIVRMVEGGRTGIYNALGPEPPVTTGQILDTAKVVSAGDAHFTWVSEAFLAAHQVVPWTDLPVWVPESAAGFFAFDNRKAIASGLTFRPLEDTVRATLEWDRTRPANHVWPVGLTSAREAELLADWSRLQT